MRTISMPPRKVRKAHDRMSTMIVVLQLERIGDLVQSLDALRLLAAHRRPVLLVVREEIAEWAKPLLPEGVELRSPERSALAELSEAMARSDDAQAMSCAREVVAGLEIGGGAQWINFTWHRLGAWLARASRAEQMMGSYLSDQGEHLIRGWWALYPLAAVDALPGGRVQMNDVRRWMVGEALGLAAAQCVRPCLPEIAKRSEKRGVVVMVGAGSPARILPADRLAGIVRSARERGEAVDLVGGEAERSFAQEVMHRAGVEVGNLVGETDPPSVIERMKEARVVIGADTGLVHLAAHLGTRVVMWMSGRAHVWETGPMGAGHIVIQGLPSGASETSMLDESALIEGLSSALNAEARGTEPVLADTSRCGGRWRDLDFYASELADDEIGGTVFRKLDRSGRDQEALATRKTLARFMRLNPDAERPSSAVEDLLSVRQAVRMAASLRSELGRGASKTTAEGLNAFAALWKRITQALHSRPETQLLGAWIQVREQHIERPEPALVLDVYHEIASRLESTLCRSENPVESLRGQESLREPV